jgi:hypothetical protein
MTPSSEHPFTPTPGRHRHNEGEAYTPKHLKLDEAEEPTMPSIEARPSPVAGSPANPEFVQPGTLMEEVRGAVAEATQPGAGLQALEQLAEQAEAGMLPVQTALEALGAADVLATQRFPWTDTDEAEAWRQAPSRSRYTELLTRLKLAVYKTTSDVDPDIIEGRTEPATGLAGYHNDVTFSSTGFPIEVHVGSTDPTHGSSINWQPHLVLTRAGQNNWRVQAPGRGWNLRPGETDKLGREDLDPNNPAIAPHHLTLVNEAGDLRLTDAGDDTYYRTKTYPLPEELYRRQHLEEARHKVHEAPEKDSAE